MLGKVITRAGKSAIVALRKPWVSLILFVVLLIDGCTLGPNTIAGGILSPARCCRCCGWPYAEAFVVRSDEKLSLISADTDPPVAEESVVASIVCDPRSKRTGVWAVTREYWEGRLWTQPWARDLTPEELDDLRLPMAEIIDRDWQPRYGGYSNLIRYNIPRFERVLWSGYVHNCISTLIALCAAMSMGWVRDSVRARRAALNLARGSCGACGYDLRGRVGHGCPECGWRRDSAASSDRPT